MTLLNWFRHPDQKPPFDEHLERRQNEVERRLKLLSPDGARHSRELMRSAGRRTQP